MEWFITDRAGQEIALDVSRYELSRFLDASRPAQAKIAAAESSPALFKQWLRAEEDGDTIFSGYISGRPAVDSGKMVIEGRGVEALLWQKACGNYGYPSKDVINNINYARLSHLFSSDPPDQGYDRYRLKGCIGLLWAAASKIPPGRGYFTKGYVPFPYGGDAGISATRGPWVLFDYTNWIFRLPGGGTNSRIGSAPIYINGSLMTEEVSLSALKSSSALSVYRDAQDLYMKPLESGLQYLGELNNDYFASYAFDTRVRLGNLDNPDTAIEGPVSTKHTDKFGDVAVKLATIHGLNVRYRYQGYLARMDFLEDFEDDGLFEIQKEDYHKATPEPNASPAPDALIGLGHGSKEVRQVHSVCNLEPGGAFLEATAEYAEAFNDPYGSLYALTLEEWEQLQTEDIFNLTSDRLNHLIPGNPVLLEKEDGSIIEAQVAKVVRRSGKATSISIGGREKDLIDAAQAMASASSLFQAKNMIEVGGTASASGNITIGDVDSADTPYTSASFTAPAYATYAGGRPRWLLDVGISAPANTYFYPGYCTFWVCVHSATATLDSYTVPRSATQWYLLGDSVTGIDITDNINWGGTNYIRIHCRFRGSWSTLPTLTCSISSKLYIRRVI